MNCKDCQSVFPDLLLNPGAPTNAAAKSHVESCAACRQEFQSLEATFALLDSWKAPEPSPYFDQKLAVRLREEQARAPEGWFERLKSQLLFNTGRQFRPALAGALALILLVGGGTVRKPLRLWSLHATGPRPQCRTCRYSTGTIKHCKRWINYFAG